MPKLSAWLGDFKKKLLKRFLEALFIDHIIAIIDETVRIEPFGLLSIGKCLLIFIAIVIFSFFDFVVLEPLLQALANQIGMFIDISAQVGILISMLHYASSKRLGPILGMVGAFIFAVGISGDVTGAGRGAVGLDWNPGTDAHLFDPVRFPTYYWFHFAQFVGFNLIVAALFLFHRRFSNEPTMASLYLIPAGALTTIVLTAILQATGGIALALITQVCDSCGAGLVALSIIVGVTTTRGLLIGTMLLMFVPLLRRSDKPVLSLFSGVTGIVWIGTAVAVSLVGYAWTGQGIMAIAETMLIYWILAFSASSQLEEVVANLASPATG